MLSQSVVCEDKTTPPLRQQQCYLACVSQKQRYPLSTQQVHIFLQPPPHHPLLHKLGMKLCHSACAKSSTHLSVLSDTPTSWGSLAEPMRTLSCFQSICVGVNGSKMLDRKGNTKQEKQLQNLTLIFSLLQAVRKSAWFPKRLHLNPKHSITWNIPLRVTKNPAVEYLLQPQFVYSLISFDTEKYRS